MVGIRSARVQVRPWGEIFYRRINWLLDTKDAVYCPQPKRMVNLRYTVFIGGILRTIRACDLAAAFSKFGEVVASTIDLGKL